MRSVLGLRAEVLPVLGLPLELLEFEDADRVGGAFWSGPTDYLRGGMP